MSTVNPDPSATIRVGMADDDPLVRRALTHIIDRYEDLTVAWAVASGEEAVERMSSGGQGDQSSAAHDPAQADSEVDVLLLDVNMPGINGIEAARVILENQPDLPIIMLTTLDRNQYAAEVIGTGAVGFLAKDDSEDRLTTAIRAAHHGIAVFNRETAHRLANEPMGRNSHVPTESPLTDKEIAVMELVSQSMTNGQIGRRLGVSEATVKSHISTIIAKLGCTDRVGMVTWGFHNGILR